MKRPWFSGQMPYSFWGYMTLSRYGNFNRWHWERYMTLRDQWVEDIADMIGTYCAGGEL